MKLLYYPGCTLKTSAKNLEKSAFEIAKTLGYELVEMDDWTCCGVVSSLTDDDLMHHLAPLRSLIHVEDQGEDKVITLCDMCCNTLKQTNLRVKEKPDDLETLNLFMDRENDYKGTVEVLHFLEFLRDEVGFDVLKKKVKKPLKGLKIMPYYGCMMLRPREVAIDDAEDPVIFNELLTALGATVIDRAHRISSYAVERGADAMILSCPLCRFNLDARGKEAEKLFKGYKQIPVFYYTQLIAVALGLDKSVCGFEEHTVDPTMLLKKKGL